MTAPAPRPAASGRARGWVPALRAGALVLSMVLLMSAWFAGRPAKEAETPMARAKTTACFGCVQRTRSLTRCRDRFVTAVSLMDANYPYRASQRERNAG